MSARDRAEGVLLLLTAAGLMAMGLAVLYSADQTDVATTPIAGFAERHGERLFMRGLVGSPDGSTLYRSEGWSDLADAEALGKRLAEDLLAQGADTILSALYQERIR